MRRAHYSARPVEHQPSRSAEADEPRAIDLDALLDMDALREAARRTEAAIWTATLPLVAVMAIVAWATELLP